MTARLRAPVGPYGAAAPEWTAAGWPAVLPLPPRAKYPPPGGFTGRARSDPSPAQVDRWLRTDAHGNACLRLPPDVVGLDVDDYGPKVGRATWEAHVNLHGQPPATWVVTNRDGISGIRLFRAELVHPVRASLAGGDVDVIRREHRVVVLPPSVHPEGRRYRLLDPHGRLACAVPAPGDLPLLPAAWVRALVRAPKAARGPRPSRQPPTPQVRIDSAMVEFARHSIKTREAQRLREQAGLTIKAMASALGVSEARASHLERGQLHRVRDHLLDRYGRWLSSLCRS